MTTRRILQWGVLLTIATLLAIWLIDGVVAAAVANVAPRLRPALGALTHVVEIVFGFPLSKFASGAVVVLAALVLFCFPARRLTARLLLYVGLSQLTTRLVAGVLKNVFLRARPFEALTSGAWQDRFFVDGGSSFPSGHAAHFWGFFFAIAIAFPRIRIPALILAVAISVTRVLVNDHYVGDVLASAAIAAFVAYGYAFVLVPVSLRASAPPRETVSP